LDCAGLSDAGCVRPSNQDQFLIANLKKSMLVDSTSLPMSAHPRLYGGSMGRLLMVADGMGGHAAGERASTLAIDCMIDRLLNSVHWFFNLDRDPEDHFLDDLKGLLRSAHQRIIDEGLAHLEQQGMGTTLTLAYVIWPRLYVVHAGDSRCYLFRRGTTERLTIDHTLARQLVDSGGMKAEEEASSRWSNVLWNVLGGGNGELTAEVRRVDLVPGDALLLCSDGLYRYFEDDELCRLVTGGDCARTVCEQLVRLAKERGGRDNITAVVGLFGLENGEREGTMVEMEVPMQELLKPGGNQRETGDFEARETEPG
jgi:protein phosphatase